MKPIILIAAITFASLTGSAQLASINPGVSEPDKVTTITNNPAKPVIFEFRAIERSFELQSIELPEDRDNNSWGDEADRLKILFERKYTYQEAIVPGNMRTRTIIRKPMIYETVRKVEKSLMKAVRNEEINPAEAAISMKKILLVAVNILDADTRDFEQALKHAESVEDRLDIFLNRTQLVY